MMQHSLQIISVSTEYPGPRSPRSGLFIRNRLAALASLEAVRVVHLETWFPLLKPWRRQVEPPQRPPVWHQRMFYLPKLFKGLDSFWLKKALVHCIKELFGDSPVDLIDAHFGYPEGAGCVKAGLELGLPVFITMRGIENPMLRDPVRGPQVLWALQQATGIVCVAHSLRDLAIRHGIPAEKLRVIPNAVNRKLYCPGDQAEARSRLQLPARGKLIVCVAMLIQGKGQHLAVKALAGLRQKHLDLQLALIGGKAHEPAYPDTLRKLVSDLGLTEAVLLTGSLPPEQVVDWLRAADLFVLPTFDEGCCNAIVEAQACGLPVVTTPVGDNPVLVAPPERGLLVPVDDVAALEAALDEALGRSWDRGAIARSRADYTWDEAARQTSAFFRERLGRSVSEAVATAISSRI